ncbi:PE family protein [Gordonia paraffinivorans]|uniref:PE family protein n=1 Tax=Gordonia paraffinivorans TaxID=175628 RepID=UPI000D60D4D9|nr:PE family protein [Gordonia paraffinivorans]MBY4573646.1 PE family protein [Gordonia paraffinivorans]PWD41863.1 PE family protein [Gordonia paraffinivorans]
MSDNQIRVEPAELVTAAAELDKIADRLESTLVGTRDALSVPAQGRDEVSLAAAASFTTVAEKFGQDTASGVLEMRKIAATLRAQAAGLMDGDADASAALRV